MLTETRFFQPHDWVPNNQQWPVVLYVGALKEAAGDALAKKFEARFNANGWPARWRDGVYDFHHYHSTAHEVLGCFAGQARLWLGGPGGEEVAMRAGDAVLLPAGTGHRCVDCSDDFQVVGAYPTGQEWDICRAAPTAQMLARIRAVPLPAADPITGNDPLVTPGDRASD